MTASTLSDPVVTIVVAAGSGVRLGAGVSKALREVRGRTLVARSVRRLAAGGCSHAIVVIPAGAESAFAAALAEAPIPCRLVPGGAERQDSVRNGLVALESDPAFEHCRIVLVHDAARAFVPAEMVARVVDAVARGAVAVVPAVAVADTTRTLTEVGSTVIDRAGLRAVQTPQGFARAALVEAHQEVARTGLRFTDDAAVCEYVGATVTLVDGDRRALKVTEPLDLLFADALAQLDD